jgi:hypothetical protein
MAKCIAITLQGTQCIRNGTEHIGGVRCGGHWPMYANLIRIYGENEAHRIQTAEDTRHVMLAQQRNNQRTQLQEEKEEEKNQLNELQRFATDNQNVHTTLALNQTKTIVASMLEIHVPDDYKWNVYTISKTPGEIISNCQLSINAGRVMMDKYTLSDDIYEMGEGIYGKVLDAVWQYIKHSDHKTDLCKILAQELKDNVGQCLQGNLSRLCNVLAGYMDGVGSQESLAEILGRRFAAISTRDQGIAILNELGVSGTMREEWLSAF